MINCVNCGKEISMADWLRLHAGSPTLCNSCGSVLFQGPPVVKPPLGLRPRCIVNTENRNNRIKEIMEAMLRYANVNKEIPSTWMVELSELVEKE